MFANKHDTHDTHISSVEKENPLFLHEIEWKNNGFLFITPNIFIK